MSQFPYIDDYFEASATGPNKGFMFVPDPDMPSEMCDPEKPAASDGYKAWKLIPSTTTDADLNDLEESHRIKYPPIYRAFLKSFHYYRLASFGVEFSSHVIHRWKTALKVEYEYECHRSLLARGFIPFGAEQFMDAGATCFDTNNILPNGDCPIVFWDHEWVGTNKEIRPLFSSGELMFASLAFAAFAGGNFQYHDDREDDPADLPLKLKKMATFLSIDPEGAGGVARDYWTTWGVNPDNEA